MLNVSAIFIIFAISHYHSYTGVLHIWQSILKAINIGVIIFNHSFLSTLMRVARMTHGFLLNCPTAPPQVDTPMLLTCMRPLIHKEIGIAVCSEWQESFFLCYFIKCQFFAFFKITWHVIFIWPTLAKFVWAILFIPYTAIIVESY
jgi:hypothetical protein